MAVDIYHRVFIFSREQQEQKIAVDKKMGRKTVFGTVLVNGVPKTYTDILTSMSNAKFADSIEVTSGDIRKIRFEKPRSI